MKRARELSAPFGLYFYYINSGRGDRTGFRSLLWLCLQWLTREISRLGLDIFLSRVASGNLGGANSLWPYSMNGTRKPNRRWSRFPQLCSDYCWAGTMTAYASLRQRHLRRSVELHLLTAPDGSTKSYPDALNRRTQMTLIRKVRECGIFSVGCFSRF
jgi:hypothetical protein